ncbi:MAG: hypothetical protein MUF71_17950 [Candidatus Kapabacteria bacterium]|jgi:hypothetical protein|nr:hypothetical protein [Candidatus Kapabacteria bacterium]
MAELRVSFRAQQALNMLAPNERTRLQKEVEKFLKSRRSKSSKTKSFLGNEKTRIVETQGFYLFFDISSNQGEKAPELADIIATDNILITATKAQFEAIEKSTSTKQSKPQTATKKAAKVPKKATSAKH